MPVTLIKIVDGTPAVSDTLENEQILQCALCDEVYRLGYSDSEWNRVKDWLTIAERAIREDHKRNTRRRRLTWNGSQCGGNASHAPRGD